MYMYVLETTEFYDIKDDIKYLINFRFRTQEMMQIKLSLTPLPLSF